MGNVVTSPETMDDEIKKHLTGIKETFEQKWDVKTKNELLVDYFEAKDYILIKTVGTGSFGRVMVCNSKDDDEKFLAVKCLSKECIIEKEQLEHTYSEYKIMATVPPMEFLVNLLGFGQDNAYLYMVFEFVAGGELFSLLRSVGRIPEITATFYGAQVLSALYYLHNLNILYRDLKPENILFTANGYLKLTDFGFAKRCLGRTFTLCGTPEYLAPEIILCQGYHKAVDWWAFGILLFEMVCGHPPFYSENPMEIYKQAWLQKRHAMRMMQRGLRYNHSRFYTDSTNLEVQLPKQVSRLLSRIDNSRQDIHGSTGESSQGSTGESSKGSTGEVGQGFTEKTSQDSKTSIFLTDHDNPCAIPASMSKLLHYVDVHDQEEGQDEIEFPVEVTEDFKDFIHEILQPDPTRRIGNLREGPFDIKRHKLFKKVPWGSLLAQRVKAPYIPKIDKAKGCDTRNFRRFDSGFSLVTDGNNLFESEFSKFPRM